MDHQITKLSNGLRLVTYQMPHLESVTVMVGVGAGSRFESRRINGLSHFLEHMAFKGTKKRPSTLAIASEVDAVGGLSNAFTDKEFTGFYLKLAAKHKELAFDILSDMLTNSLLKPEEIEKEKGVIVEEMNTRNDTPTIQSWDSFIELLYGDSPMGWDTIGKIETVKAIQRQDFLTYINSLYFPRNMVVAVAGKINLDDAKKLSTKYFSSLWRVGKKVTNNISLDQKKPKIKLVYKKTDQAHFCLGVPAYSLSHKDRFALGVLSGILGSGMSSRLFIEVREKRGLAYYVGTSHDLYTDSGYLINRAGVKLEKTDEAIKIIVDQMLRLVTERVSQKELDKVKEMWKGNIVLGMEDSHDMAERLCLQLVLENKVRTLKQAIELIDKVTSDDVQRVAKDLFRPEKLNLVVVGPYKENLENRFKNLLK